MFIIYEFLCRAEMELTKDATFGYVAATAREIEEALRQNAQVKSELRSITVKDHK